MLRFSLIRQITIVVFVCFVAIGTVALTIAYSSVRDQIFTKIDSSLELTLPVLASDTAQRWAQVLVSEEDSDTGYPVIGLAMELGYGRIVTFGETEGLVESQLSTETNGLFNQQTKNYDRVTIRKIDRTGKPLRAWFRFDMRRMDQELTDTLVNSILFLILTSIFITAVVVLALRPILLRPLLKLRKLMIIAQEQGLDKINAPSRELARRDELGDLYRTFERMRIAMLAAEESKTQTINRLHGFTGLGADCFWEVDRHFRFSYLTGDIESLFGRNAESMLGQSYLDLARTDSLPIADPGMCLMALRNQGNWQGDVSRADDNGHIKTIRIVANLLKNTNGNVTGIRGSITDVSVTSDLERTLAHQERHDGLTGLVNRTEFEIQLNRKLALLPSARRPACVLVINLDRFKLVNDACGHDAGDALLTQIADLIQAAVREDDVLARLDGDSFALLLDSCPLDNGLLIAEKIRAGIDQHRFPWKKEVYSVGASIGLSVIDRTVGRKENVLINADAACYKAKQFGRNQIQVYDALDKTLLKRNDQLYWVAQVTQAIEEDRFVLFYQPIQPLTEERPGYVHLEVLIRMQTREGEILPPGAFLPAAERFSLMDRIDKWVVNKVIQWLEEQSVPAEMELSVCINLSGASAADPIFQRFLNDTIQKANINPAHICFEMTETAAVQNLDETGVFLAQMRALGCQIALDDFGTGFSSLEYIKQLPLDYIKIDGAFIKDLATNQLDQSMVRFVSDVARHLKVRTVAEYVENAQILEILHELNVDLAQGYFIAKPTPLPPIADLIEQANSANLAAIAAGRSSSSASNLAPEKSSDIQANSATNTEI